MWLRRFGACAALLALTTLLPSVTLAEGTSTCAAFIDQYLVAGWPSGTTFDLTLLGERQLSSTMTLLYPRYPRVAGVLSGQAIDGSVSTSISISVRDNRLLEVELGSGERFIPTDCSPTALRFEPGAMRLP